MRIIALDIGDARVGIAASDASGLIASPVKVLPCAEVVEYASSFRRIIEDYEPEALLCGLPLSLSGEESEQTRHVRQLAETIGERTGLPVLFADERLSSVEAKRSLREEGLSTRSMKGKTDMIAAALFLQSYLDANSNEGDR